MKKIILIIAIAFANTVFTSCTDLDEDLENKPSKTEISATGGEEEQDPDEEEDPANGS
jgi:hypothetical protein